MDGAKLVNGQTPLEIFIDDETKLTFHRLLQHYVKLEEVGKNWKLNGLLDSLEFNQVIFVKSVARAIKLITSFKLTPAFFRVSVSIQVFSKMNDACNFFEEDLL